MGVEGNGRGWGSMRKIKILILRLLCDPEMPLEMRGSIQSLEESSQVPFSDEQSLLALLHQVEATSQGNKRKSPFKRQMGDGLNEVA